MCQLEAKSLYWKKFVLKMLSLNGRPTFHNKILIKSFYSLESVLPEQKSSTGCLMMFLWAVLPTPK